jgi:allophanate hydrolase subunit 1
VARLRGAGSIDLAPLAAARSHRHGGWQVLLTTEEPLFAPDPRPPQIDVAAAGPAVRFERPGAVILKKR